MSKRTDRQIRDEVDKARWEAFRARHALDNEIALLEEVTQHKAETTITRDAALSILEWLHELRELRTKGETNTLYFDGPIADDCHAIFNLAHRAGEMTPKHVGNLPMGTAEQCLKWLRSAAQIVDSTLEPALIQRANNERTANRASDTANTELDDNPRNVED